MTSATATPLPTDLDGLRALIARESARLTPRMRDAARYAVEHPNDIALNPVAAVAEMSSVAPAAFIRMAKALGFGGYSELQRMLREPLQHATKLTFRERIRHYGGEQALDHPEDPAEVLRAFSRANIVSLEHLQDDAAGLPLGEAITLIANARIVHVLGLRRSYAVAAYLAYALNRIGRPAVQITGLGGAISEQASMANADDLLIAISFPPYAADTLQVCEQVRASGAKRLAITDAFLSPVAKDADLVLEVNDAKLLGFRSLTSAMSLAQALAVGLAFSKRKKRQKNRRAGRTATDTIPSVSDLLEVDC
jgi:DNA-binding MurR/RpiR family transcriptional regulator